MNRWISTTWAITVVLVAADRLEASYSLERDVYELVLEGSLPSRVTCTISADSSSSVVVWDPVDSREGTRYVLLPKSSIAATLRCQPRLTTVPADKDSTTIAYVVAPTNMTVGAAPAPITITPTLHSSASSRSIAAYRIVARKMTPAEATAIIERFGGGSISTTQLRSLDPITLVDDGLTALASIALERASAAGKAYAKDVARRICTDLTVERVFESMEGSPLKDALKTAQWNGQPLLRRTCGLLDTLRLDELVSSLDLMWRALALDGLALSMIFFRAAIQDVLAVAPNVLITVPPAPLLSATTAPELDGLFDALERLLGNALTGGVSNTERDAQVLLLQLARLDLLQSNTETPWRNAVQLGLAVLQECLRTSECTADQLDLALRQEAALAARNQRGEFPTSRLPTELAGLMGRAANVLRPPPGTLPRVTAANALSVVVDVLQREIQTGMDALGKKEAPQLAREEAIVAMFDMLRGIAEAMQGESVQASVSALERALHSMTALHCQSKGSSCTVPIKSQKLRRSFRVLSAVASYGASYRLDDSSKSSEELTELRAEERKKAMESLIDSVTDRSDRDGDVVVGLGVNVGLGVDYRARDDEDGYWNRVPLAMRTGFAVQWLNRDVTGAWCLVPEHYSVSILDLAQYVTVDDDIAKPELTSSLHFGAEVGYIWGNASFPILTALHGGYLPRVTYESADVSSSKSEFSFGVSVGIYVPLIDFN